MIIESTEFFKKLPPKTCEECHNQIDEQHESYSTTCNDCLDKHK